MTRKLPVVSGKQLIEFFKMHGFEQKSQKGSHITIKKKGIHRRLVVPDHQELSVGVILSNLNTAGISRKDFIAAMRKSSQK